MYLDKRAGVARFDAVSPTRMTSEWLGLEETELSAVPEWVIERIALRLSGADPEATLREELLTRLHKSMTELYQLARTDQLTGLANRRAIEERLSDEIRRAQRYRRELTVLLVDVDGLKVVNDRFGHPAGDDLIREVGRRIAAAVRGTDLAGRWGGDEFAVICPETDGAATRSLAAKLTESVSSQPVKLPGRLHPVTISVGWGVDGTTGDAASLLAAADASLYAAKGRNSAAR